MAGIVPRSPAFCDSQFSVWRSNDLPSVLGLSLAQGRLPPVRLRVLAREELFPLLEWLEVSLGPVQRLAWPMPLAWLE